MIKNLKNIKSLFLISGQYLLSDKEDRRLLLTVNYHKGTYDFLLFKADSLLEKSARIFAKDLIKRKSGVNLVE